MNKKNDFMGKIQGVADKTIGFAKEQIKKVEPYFEEMKEPVELKVKIAKKEYELKKLFTKYGEAVFYAEPQETEETYNEIESLLEEIKQANERLNEIEVSKECEVADEESEEKGNVFCTKCGNELEHDDVFCNKCGTKLKK